MTAPYASPAEQAADVTRLLDEWDRYTERVSSDLVYASETHWNALVAAVRAGLALADRQAAAADLPVLKGDRFDAGVAATYRDSAEQIRAALSAPLAGQHTTDEETPEMSNE